MKLKMIIKNKSGFDIVISNPPYIQMQKNKGFLSKEFENLNYKTFDRTGDIYCLFYEKSNTLLNKSGYCCLITSNKWLRANYGIKLRKYIVEQTSPKLIIDLGLGVFETANVDTNILLFKSSKQDYKLDGCNYNNYAQNIFNLVKYNSFTLEKPKNGEIFLIINETMKKLKEKIELIGIPIKDLNVTIRSGIKSGCNDAFTITTKVKNDLVKKDSNCEHLFKKILRGKDLDKYKCDWADLWFINMHNGIKKSSIPRVDVNDYPSIKDHLNAHFEALKDRVDKGSTPYNVRDCAFIDDIEQKKIIYSEIVQLPQFYYDEEFFYPDASVFFIFGENLKFLIGVLNSHFGHYVFENFYAGAGLGNNTYRYKKYFLKNFPIPKVKNDSDLKLFGSLVDEILHLNKYKDFANIKNIEIQLDYLVYKFYKLTNKEIELIENCRTPI